MAEPVMFRHLPKSRIPKQVARLNQIAGSSENAFKFGPRYTKMEIFLINQTKQPASKGLKFFWRQHMPTLKFHNEDFGFVLKRVKVDDPAAADKVPVRIDLYDAAHNKTEIDCSFKSESDILAELLNKTEATPVAEAEIPRIHIKSKTDGLEW